MACLRQLSASLKVGPPTVLPRAEQLEVKVETKHLQTAAFGSCPGYASDHPLLQAEGEQLSRPSRREVHHPVRHDGRGPIHGSAGGKAPQLGAGAGVQRVQYGVVRADINHPIRHGGRGDRISGRVGPQLGAGAGVQRVHVVVVGADINHPIRHGGRGFHIAAGGVAPQQGASARVQRVYVLVKRADINYTIGYRRRGKPAAGDVAPQLGAGAGT